MSKIKYIQSIKAKEVSCVELTNTNNIEKQNKTLNAYVNVTGEEAIKTAIRLMKKLRRKI